jgi:hypothetical protein
MTNGLNLRRLFSTSWHKHTHKHLHIHTQTNTNICLFLFEVLLSQVTCYMIKIKIQRTIILPVLYGRETWSLTTREERRLRVFENRVGRWIFRPKRGSLTGEWRKLHNEEFNLYGSPSIFRVIKSRRMRWAGHVARMGGRAVYRALVGKPEGKGPLGRPRHRWKGNIKMDF